MSAEIISADNVIPVDFRPEFLALVIEGIKQLGFPAAKAWLIKEGEHPTFIKVIMNKAVKGSVL